MSDAENSPRLEEEDANNVENEESRVEDDPLGDLDSKNASEKDLESEGSYGKALDDEDLGEISYKKADASGSDDEEGKIKHKKEKVGQIRKKVKKGDTSDGEEKDYDVDEGDEDRQDDESGKKKASEKGKRGKNKIDQVVVEAECLGIVAQMKEAYERDNICNTEKKPAVYKIKAIKDVAALLRKPQLQECFLQMKGLDLIANWLEKMPDGSMPGQTLKKRLIEIINSLPVDEDHVKDTLLGKRIFELYKNPKEESEIRKSLKHIIDKWSRIAMRVPVDYSDRGSFDDDIRSRKKDQSLPLDNTRVEKIKDIFYNPNKPYDRRELNRRVGYNYTIKPKGIDDKETKPIKTSAGPDYDKMYNDFKRKRKTLK